MGEWPGRCPKPDCAETEAHEHRLPLWDGANDEPWWQLYSLEIAALDCFRKERGLPKIVWESLTSLGNPVRDSKRYINAGTRLRDLLGIAKTADYALVLEAAIARIQGQPALAEAEHAYQARLQTLQHAFEQVVGELSAAWEQTHGTTTAP